MRKHASFFFRSKPRSPDAAGARPGLPGGAGLLWAALALLPMAVALSGCGRKDAPAAPNQAELAGPSTSRADMCSGANVVGVGLRGEYFAEPAWRGAPALVRTDASVEFTGVNDLPEEARGALPRSIRWSGWIKAPTAGAYRFHLQPRQARLSISRQVVKVAEAAADAEPVEMVAGRFYPIQVEVDDLKEAELPVRLEWTAPHGARYLIPRALLNLPTETVVAPRPASAPASAPAR